MKIAVAGTGYVGLSIATLLAQHNEVVAVDIIPEKVDMINKRISPIQDEYIEKFFAEKELNLTATLDGAAGYKCHDRHHQRAKLRRGTCHTVNLRLTDNMHKNNRDDNGLKHQCLHDDESHLHRVKGMHASHSDAKEQQTLQRKNNRV